MGTRGEYDHGPHCAETEGTPAWLVPHNVCEGTGRP
jgi:hypothetical protein